MFVCRRADLILQITIKSESFLFRIVKINLNKKEALMFYSNNLLIKLNSGLLHLFEELGNISQTI